MLKQVGLNTTGKFGWDVNHGGNGNGLELRAYGKYYYINKGRASLVAYAAALAGEPYHSKMFGDIDPIETIAGKEIISYKQAQDELAVIRNFLNSFDWRNASEMERANRAAKLMSEAKFSYHGGKGNDVYDNLVGKEGICGSFANRLTRPMGMNSLYQEDGALNHAWNYVQIDGKWYEFDGSTVAELDYPVKDVFITNSYGQSPEFNSYRLEKAKKQILKYYDAKALSILGFNQ
ncbi:hypothetical protein ACWYRQ_19365 [Clostridioides difficile]